VKLSEEQHRRDCLARHWVYCQTMDETLVWLEKQSIAFRKDMQARMDNERQAQSMLSCWERERIIEFINNQEEPQVWRDRLNRHKEIRKVRKRSESATARKTVA